MSDPVSLVQSLRRPRLLLDAAKIGMQDYNRARILKRVAPGKSVDSPLKTLRALIPVEESLEEARCARDAAYAPSRHVEVLIALLAEIQALKAPRLVQ